MYEAPWFVDFLHHQVLEEFETDDGISYWFDRRTGETFWERPLCEEEKVKTKIAVPALIRGQFNN